MKGFKRCSNGHFYKETLSDCPHCAAGAGSGSGNPDLDKTAANTSAGGDFDKTQIFGQGNVGSNQGATQVPGSNNATQVFGAGNAGSAPVRDLNKTYIGGITDEGEDSNSTASAPRAARMITGWLVSFTLDPMGVDYRIYEGSNSIGRDSDNTISIKSDNTISGKHVIIVRRSGQFWIEDAMTSNGTFINGEELIPRKAYSIKDGDEVKLGDTVFTFKTWH